MTNEQWNPEYLNLKGLNINNNLIIDSNGNVTINGGSISWNAVTGTDGLYNDIDAAQSAADAAQSTANSASSTANSAYNMASDAYDDASAAYRLADRADDNATSALNDLALLANGKYSGGTFIDGKNIYAPNLYGDTINLMDSYSRVVGTMSLQYSNTFAFDLTSNLSLRMQAASGYNAYLGTGGGPYLLLGKPSGSNVAQCQIGGGVLVIGSDNYGSTLPANSVKGQVFFLI